MDVQILQSPDDACDQFVRQMPNAKLCHLPAWGFMVQRVMRHESLYLAARQGGAVRGVLPLTHVRSRLFGSRMISQAFASYGGPLADGPEVVEALFQKAVAVAGERGCESVEFRSDEQLPFDLAQRGEKIAMRLRLADDADTLWGSFKSETKVRNHIRKAEKRGVTTEAGRGELLDEFYGVYARRMHQLGTPCYSRKLFAGLLETFPDSSRLFVARFEGQTVGARLVFAFNGLVESIWGMTRVEYNRHSPNHLLYWAVFKHYCGQGGEWFDFGPSTAGGTHYKFKKQWGSVPIELYYQCWLPEGRTLEVLSPDNPKFKRRIAMWKKLPYWLTRLAGPVISRQLP